MILNYKLGLKNEKHLEFESVVRPIPPTKIYTPLKAPNVSKSSIKYFLFLL